MLLARAVARRREMAVRLALGAPRRRLVQQLLTESLLLYLVGAVGGVLVAMNATHLLAQIPLPVNVPYGALDLSPDARVLAFTLVVSLATGVAFGLAPALQSTRVNINGQLRSDTGGAGSRRFTAQSVIIAGQMAVSLLLLVAAGLFLRALDRGRRVDLGFDTSNVAVAGFDIGTYGYDDAKGRQFYRTLKDQMAATPGVVAVSYTHDLPLGMGYRANLQIDGTAAPSANQQGTPVSFADVDAGYFAVMKLPIMEGREFATTDGVQSPLVAVVNQAFASRFWPNGALGRTFHRGKQVVTVVGVAHDAKYAKLDEALEPFVYFAITQEAKLGYHAELLVRSSGDPARLALAIRTAVREFDPLLPVPTVTTLGAATSAELFPQRVGAIVTAVLGVVGLLLAGVGLYGIVAYSVGQRRHEIGVRLALGANRGDVLRLVVGQGMRPVVAGMAIGLVLAVAATRLVMSYLFGVSPLDAVAYVAGATMLTAVALTASYLPARHAAATDLMQALRGE